MLCIDSMNKKMKYTLDNGWCVEKVDNDAPVLHITPIPKTVFNKNKRIIISDVIFEDIRAGEINLKNLFRKHDLHKLIINQTAEEVRPHVKHGKNGINEYQGSDFFCINELGKYFMRYRLSIQGDGERQIEISKEVFLDARSGDYSTSDLFKKYNLYHLDVPDNDVTDPRDIIFDAQKK